MSTAWILALLAIMGGCIGLIALIQWGVVGTADRISMWFYDAARKREARLAVETKTQSEKWMQKIERIA